MTTLHLRKSIGLPPSLTKILPQMISQLSLIKRPWLATCVAVFAVVLPVASFAQLPSFKSQNLKLNKNSPSNDFTTLFNQKTLVSDLRRCFCRRPAGCLICAAAELQKSKCHGQPDVGRDS